jgi:hypothetical protein
MEPFDFIDAARLAVFTDPERAAFCVWEAKAHKGARVVNDPGSLNFNGLNTRDLEGARSFYGSVFGWETFAMDGGAEMWMLSGYGDFLERYNLGLRKRRAEAGVPDGFEDVVAPSIRSRTTRSTRRPIGARPSRSTTPPPRPRRPPSSAET